MTDNDQPPAAHDELWTPGEAAEYLNGGGVDFKITPRRVSQMAQRGELPSVQPTPGRWRKVSAAAVREMRRQWLADLEQGQHRPQQ